MTCIKATTPPLFPGAAPGSVVGYATEAECLAACKEGACCEGTTCSVKPQCQCQGTGQTFKGVGTVCDETVGYCCGPDTVENVFSWFSVAYGQGTSTTPRTFPKCVSAPTDTGKAICESQGGTWVGACGACGTPMTGLGGSPTSYDPICVSANPLP